MSNQPIHKSQVRNALKKVIDPELGVNIVDLGLIYDIQINTNNHINLTMTLTTPGCPLASVFDMLVNDSLDTIPGFDANSQLTIKLTFDPPWITDMMNPETRAQLGFDDL